MAGNFYGKGAGLQYAHHGNMNAGRAGYAASAWTGPISAGGRGNGGSGCGTMALWGAAARGMGPRGVSVPMQQRFVNTPMRPRIANTPLRSHMQHPHPLGAAVDQPEPPLDMEKLEGITAYLSACGGAAPLGKVTTQFEGVKKAQLEEHFYLSGPTGNPILSLSPDIEPGMLLLDDEAAASKT